MAPFSPFPRAHPRGKNCGGTPKKQVLYSPSYNPLDSARHAPRRGRGYELCCLYAGRMMSMKSLLQLEMVGARFEQGRPREGAALYCVSPVLCAFSCEPACVREPP